MAWSLGSGASGTAGPEHPGWKAVTYRVFDLPQHGGDFNARVPAIREAVSGRAFREARAQHGEGSGGGRRERTSIFTMLLACILSAHTTTKSGPVRPNSASIAGSCAAANYVAPEL